MLAEWMTERRQASERASEVWRMRLITRSPYDMSMEGPLSQADCGCALLMPCRAYRIIDGAHTRKCVCLPGEEGGVVKTVKGEATVRIEGVAFVYG